MPKNFFSSGQSMLSMSNQYLVRTVIHITDDMDSKSQERLKSIKLSIYFKLTSTPNKNI